MTRHLKWFATLVALLLSATLAASAQTSVTIASGSAMPIVGFNTGDSIDIVATLSTSDVNENGEGEPLVLQSSTGFPAW